MIMKKILLAFALTAAVMTAGAQIKELEPAEVFEWADPATIVEEEECEGCPEEEDCEGCPEDDEGDSASDCFPITKIKATSRLAPQGKNNYDEKNLNDYDPFTAWVEGVKGYGIGEKVTFYLEYAYDFSSLYIYNGYTKSKAAWKNNSRVKKLKVSYDGKPMFILNLKDEMGGQYFEIGDALHKGRTNQMHEYTVTFEILDVYKGDKYDDTAISAIRFGGCY